MRKGKILRRVLIGALFCALAIYGVTVFLSRQAIKNYSVHGVDVSSYQGEIDWIELQKNGIDFAFIKATEGSGYVDKMFSQNIGGISKTDVAPGAYHFMSFESDGKSQAENFIATVKKEKILLPPVIDLELYGRYNYAPPDEETVTAILDDLISSLYAEYGKMPIIYTNRRAYSLYVSGRYKDCDIWICDVVKKPELPDGRKWLFWQYSHTGKLSGYSGSEKHIDLNLFSGTDKEFKEYIIKRAVTK